MKAGTAYTVGESGRETFVPTQPGRIIPAGRGGGGRMNYTNAPTYHITPAGGVTIPQLQVALAHHDREINRTFGQRYADWRGNN